jgi:hypothetical protein
MARLSGSNGMKASKVKTEPTPRRAMNDSHQVIPNAKAGAPASKAVKRVRTQTTRRRLESSKAKAISEAVIPVSVPTKVMQANTAGSAATNVFGGGPNWICSGIEFNRPNDRGERPAPTAVAVRKRSSRIPTRPRMETRGDGSPPPNC